MYVSVILPLVSDVWRWSIHNSAVSELAYVNQIDFYFEWLPSIEFTMKWMAVKWQVEHSHLKAKHMTFIVYQLFENAQQRFLETSDTRESCYRD